VYAINLINYSLIPTKRKYMKKSYSFKFLLSILLLCMSITKANALAYWTLQINGLPTLYDVSGITGYGSNMVLGGTPFYTHTISTAFTASTSVHKIYRSIRAGVMLYGVGDSAIFKSFDDGETWAATNLSAPLYNVGADARLFYDAPKLYVWDANNVNFGNEVLVSTDSGDTWFSSGYQQPDGYGFLVHNGIAYASSIMGLQYSTDNGNNWLYVTTIGSTVNDIAVFNDTVYVATNTGIYKGTGNLQQWTTTLQQNVLCLCSTGSALMCGTQSAGVWLSDPTGRYWFSKSEDLPLIDFGVYNPITALSFNDFYVMATARFDTTSGIVRYLYTMPIEALETLTMQTAITDVQVYPNPAREEIFIRMAQMPTQPVRIMLIDMQGRVLQNKTYSNSAVMSLKPGNVPAGMYILNISDEQSSVTKKIEISN